jgi:hypothetical protein
MSEPVHRLHPLPKQFYSDETGAPFERCFDCGNAVAACEDGYLIQKAYAGDETLMEMAICCDCHEKLQASYSKESKEKMWNFYLDHGDFSTRLKKFYPFPVGDPGLWLNACMTCGAPRDSVPECLVAAHVFEGDLVYGETPLMICFDCMNKIVGLLSEESRETYDRWMDRVLPQAPECSDSKPRVRIFM